MVAQRCQKYICIGSLSTSRCHCSAMKLSILGSLKAWEGKKSSFLGLHGRWAWSCGHSPNVSVFFVLFIARYFHWGPMFSFFPSISKIPTWRAIPLSQIPAAEWLVCAGSTGRQTHGQANLQAWLKSFHSAWKICLHPAVRLQSSGTELPVLKRLALQERQRTFGGWQCWKLRWQRLRCSRWCQSDWLNPLWSTVKASLSERLKSKVFLKLHLWCLKVFLPMTQSSRVYMLYNSCI